MALGALTLGLGGVVLSLTVRDAKPAFAPLFYMFPLPVSGALLLGAALFFRGRVMRKFALSAAVFTLGWWVFQSYGWAYPVKAEWKAITWNISRPKHPFAPVVALVKAEQPDVMVLIESGDLPAEAVGYYEHALPGYRVVAESRGLTCLARGKILSSSVRGLVNGSDAAHFLVEVRGERMQVFAADLGAFPLLPRRPQIDGLAALARVGPRTLVMGDFNTPLESVQLQAMRASFTEAREGPHRGFRETWFYNLPLLSLDHVWVSRDFKPVFATRRLGYASDHSPVIATFDFAVGAK